MEFNLPVLAGTLSTIFFFMGTFPMLIKAYQTRDLRSYSKGMLLLNNAGNVIHAVYIFSLPPGPIWFLHGFYTITTALMLGWYLRYEARSARTRPASIPADANAPVPQAA
jgi:hypothetical protein